MIISSKRCVRKGLHVLGLGLALALAAPHSARATIFSSVDLSRFAAMSNAVVQGEVLSTANLIDRQGVPWTIYMLSVDKVLAGTVLEKVVGFRCIGGTNGDRRLVLSGTPRLAVGDSIVAFLHQDGECQLSGLEYGVFWKRKDAAGVERITDSRGRVLGAIGGDNPILSAEIISPERSPDIPETHASSADPEDEDSALLAPPPPAPAATILAELEAFSRAYVTKSAVLRTVVDLTGIPTFEQTRAPELDTAQVQP